MRYFVSAVLVVIPCLAMAASDCQVVEYPDHDEVVCVGDEKAPSATQSPAAQQPGLPEPGDGDSAIGDTSPPASSPGPEPSADIPTRDLSVIPTTPIPSKGEGAVIINRQGRSTQSNQQDLQNAIDARKKMIQEHNQAPAVK